MKVHHFPRLLRGTLIDRYKRFLADIELEDGRKVTAHCPNPGRMTSILPSPDAVFVSDFSQEEQTTRKLKYRWELALVNGTFIVVNTQLANRVAEQLLRYEPGLRSHLFMGTDTLLKKEVSLNGQGGATTRFDFALQSENQIQAYIEVKQVSLRVQNSKGLKVAAFPDAVTVRGRKHLESLTQLVSQGIPAVLLYVVGRDDVDVVRAAHEIDPSYAQAYEVAKDAGVKVYACQLEARIDGLYFKRQIPVL